MVMTMIKKEELRRKREWMRMLVRTEKILQLRLRIGLKAQVKVVRK